MSDLQSEMTLKLLQRVDVPVSNLEDPPPYHYAREANPYYSPLSLSFQQLTAISLGDHFS
jgi:hypothetical protein